MGQGTIISGKANNGAGIMGLMNTYKSASGIADGIGDNTNTDPSADPESTAMSRRGDANSEHPDVLIAQGLKHLEDPNIGLDEATRFAAAEQLMRAQHFGYGGGLDSNPQNQGQIKSGKSEDTGGIGKIASLVATIA